MGGRGSEPRFTGEWDGAKLLPYLSKDRLHHPGFGLFDGDLETFGLTVASPASRSMADSTIRVHSDDGLALFMFPGIHFSGVKPKLAGRRAGMWEVVNMGGGNGGEFNNVQRSVHLMTREGSMPEGERK